MHIQKNIARTRVAGILSLLLLLAGTTVYGWDAKLEAAAKRVAAGRPEAGDLNLVRQNNDVVNRMAKQGVIDNATYQKVQEDFSYFNDSKAKAAVESAGLEHGKQSTTKDGYDPGTDSDYISSGKDGKPVTPEQIKKAKAEYNRSMNKEFGTEGVDYARKLDTDLMANSKGMSKADFERVSRQNNDAYKRKAAADYEAKVRAQQKYDKARADGTLDPNAKRPPDPTLDESRAYRQEMEDFRVKKAGEAAKARAEAAKAKRADPTAGKRDAAGKSARSQTTDADMTQKMQQQAKYNKRKQGETRRLADQFDLKNPEASKLPGEASNRSMAKREIDVQSGKGTKTKVEIEGKDLTRYNRNKAATANAVDDALNRQNLRNDAEVRTGASTKTKAEADRIRQQLQSGDANNMTAKQRRDLANRANQLDADTRSLVNDAATDGAKLRPAEQGELIDRVRTEYGDDAARQLSAEMKQRNIDAAKAKADAASTRVDAEGGKVAVDADGPKTRVDADGPRTRVDADGAVPRIDADSVAGRALKGARQAADVGGKVMVGVDIGNAAQDILDVGSGKKSAAEAAETAVDTVTGGAISTGKIIVQKGGDLAGALDAKSQQQAALDQDRVLQTGLNLSRAGVSQEERDRIMRAMEKGDDSLLQDKVNDLAADGKEVAVPDRQMADEIGYGDDSVADRAKEVGAGIKDSAVRAGTFVVNTGKNLGEIGSGLTEEGVLDEVVDQARRNLNADNLKDAPGAIVDIVDANRNTYLRGQEAKTQQQGIAGRLADMGATQAEIDQAMDDWDKDQFKTARDLRIRLQAEKKAAELAAAERRAAEEAEQKKREAALADSGNDAADDLWTDDADDQADNEPDGDAPGNLRDAEAGLGEGDTVIAKGETSEVDPLPGIFSDFTDRRDTNRDTDRKSEQSLNQARTTVDTATTSAEGTLAGIQDTLDSAYDEGTKVRTDAANAANKQDMETGLGSQLTTATEGAIKTGLQAAGTAVGTAVGQRIARDADRRDRKGDRSEKDSSTTVASNNDGTTTKPKPRRPRTTSKPKPKPKPTPTYVSKPKPKPKPKPAGVCPICGRPGCPWR